MIYDCDIIIGSVCHGVRHDTKRSFIDGTLGVAARVKHLVAQLEPGETFTLTLVAGLDGPLPELAEDAAA